ncbi:phosphotransferase enzyme family protein [Amycolatopsis aidingensis]|uniref:phosphotransferase enzyme family protein n=1 Tax=Amycolatopsis aidingensis TaxID=2842453 RepID=UPI001C0CCDEA|nr:phosphotransferase [Amycolatopsis aidingensis]
MTDATAYCARRLGAWGEVMVTGMLGGARNEVLEIRLGGKRRVARRSRRPADSLEWELDLLEHLANRGFRVPRVVPTLHGNRFVDNIVVQEWLPGREPVSGADWQAVADELRRLHATTVGWPQRQGFRITSELVERSRSGDVDLGRMPSDVVAACRGAWAALSGEPAVVHGDPGAANIRISPAGVGLLDWDEARVDHPAMDLADLPVTVLPAAEQAAARAAVDAWEVAAGWFVEPEYARERLARLGRG